MVFVGAVGEVHADDIETRLAQGVHLLGGVGLGADGTNDRGSAVLLRRVVLGVELAEPLNPGPASIEVIETGDVVSRRSRRLRYPRDISHAVLYKETSH
jgi:hypothetical protein